MAATQILAANALSPIVWSKKVFEYALNWNRLARFMGPKGSNMPIIVDKELMVKAGLQTRYELDIPLSNAGGGDDSDMEGNSEAMQFFNMAMSVHERNNSVVSKGIITDQASAINILEKARNALGKWAGIQQEKDLLYCLSGLGNQNTYVGEGSSDIETVNEKAPSTNRIWYGGQTSGSSPTLSTPVADDGEIGDGGASDYQNYFFGTKVISTIKRKMQDASPRFSPIMINGRGYYVAFIHHLQTKALRNDDKWNDAQKQAELRGLLNPIWGKTNIMQTNARERMFYGAVGIWDDVILFEIPGIETRVAGEVFNDSTDTVHANIVDGTARIARSIFLGSDAMIMLWAKMWQRHLKNFDFNRKPGIGMDGIYGCKISCFRDPGANQNTNTEQEDLARYVVDTAVADDA